MKHLPPVLAGLILVLPVFAPDVRAQAPSAAPVTAPDVFTDAPDADVTFIERTPRYPA